MIKRWMAALGLLCLLSFAAPAPTQAFDIFNGVNCNSGQNSESAACSSKVKKDPNTGEPINPLTGQDGLLLNITNIVAYIAGAAAIILIVVSGIRFMTAGGDSAKVTAARQTLTGALIGIAVIVLARTLIIYVVKTLHPGP
jgi:hypothetical protein